MPRAPVIVGLGGSLRPGSTTETALAFCLRRAAELGAETELLGGAAITLPHYRPGAALGEGAALIAAVRRADGLIVASPGYHGTISGLTKNALDYLEEMRDDEPPYLSGKPVGCVATAFGWQAAVNTLATLRQIVHALRGWPSPLGAAINVADSPFDEAGELADPRVREVLGTIAGEVFAFAVERVAMGAGTEQKAPSGDQSEGGRGGP